MSKESQVKPFLKEAARQINLAREAVEKDQELYGKLDDLASEIEDIGGGIAK